MSEDPEPMPEEEPTPEPEPEPENPPAPIVATPVESLAEQVHREAHSVPESQSPSDVVPNRANIRPPAPAAPEPEPDDEAEPTEAPVEPPEAEPVP